MLTSPLLYAAITAAFAGFWDFKTGRIPNLISLGSLALALLSLVVFPQRAWSSLLGLFALGLVPLLLFLQSRGGAIGGGDVKLLGALGAWLGPDLGLAIAVTGLTLAAVAGCLQALSKQKSLRAIRLRLAPFFALAFPLVLALSSLGQLDWFKSIF